MALERLHFLPVVCESHAFFAQIVAIDYYVSNQDCRCDEGEGAHNNHFVLGMGITLGSADRHTHPQITIYNKVNDY